MVATRHIAAGKVVRAAETCQACCSLETDHSCTSR